MSKDHQFLWSRLHSFLGLIPVGLFLVFHLSLNFTAVGGDANYNDSISMMDKIPHTLLVLIEWIVIYIPLMFHAFYGIFVAFTATFNTKRFGTFRNWMFTLQRITGVFLVIFIGWHMFQTRIQRAFGEEVNFDMVASIVDNPGMLIFYIVGIVSAAFHLANGIWSFLVSWGITQSKRSQQITTYVTVVFFVILAIIGVAAILAFV